MAEHLARRGYAVEAFDLRGHGRSEGKRAFVRSFDEYLEDLERFLARVRGREPGSPVFLLGISLGGAIGTLFVIERRHDLRGLILGGAALKLRQDIPAPLLRAATWLSRRLPGLPTLRPDAEGVSRDPEVVRGIKEDPLVYHGKVPLRTGVELIHATGRIRGRMEEVRLPLLILRGTADRGVDGAGSEQLHARAGSTDKAIQRYEGLYHNILEEPEKGRVLEDLIHWLDARS